MPGQRDNLIDFDQIDLDRYDFPGLRADINQILDLQGAAVRIIRWTVLVPIVGILVVWQVFDGRMSTIALVPYVVVVAAALVVAAIAIGMALVLRSKVAKTNAAADRVVTTVASLHGDYLGIRSGEADLPMSELARVLTSELVFPALISGSNRAFATAAVTTGPAGLALRWFGRPALRVVERRVLDALAEVDEPKPLPPSDTPAADGADLVEAALTGGLPPAGSHRTWPAGTTPSTGT